MLDTMAVRPGSRAVLAALAAALLAAALLAGCASNKAKRARADAQREDTGTAATSGDGPSTGDTGEAPSRRSRALVPTILNSMPKEGVLDLGPVFLVSEERGRRDRTTVLLEAADRLGADAFVAEQRGMAEAYPFRLTTVMTYYDRYSGRPYQVTTYVYRIRGGAEGGLSPSETGFYRAIRYVDRQPGPCSFDGSGLTGDQLALLRDAGTMQEQLRILGVLISRGLIDIPVYRRARQECLRELDRREGEPPR